MKIIYIYHSCFAILEDDFTILIDYWKDTDENNKWGVVHENILSRSGKLYILSSHGHHDHFNKEILTWKENKKDIQYIFSKDILNEGKAETGDAYFIDKGEEWKDENIKIKAFGSTDQGVSFLIEFNGIKLFHSGDLNNWHWKDESTQEEIEEAEKAFLDEINQLYNFTTTIDIVMFPVDARLGEDYMLGARQFIDKIKTKIFIPMHAWENYKSANAFESYATSKSVKFLNIEYQGQEFYLDNKLFQ